MPQYRFSTFLHDKNNWEKLHNDDYGWMSLLNVNANPFFSAHFQIKRYPRHVPVIFLNVDHMHASLNFP